MHVDEIDRLVVGEATRKPTGERSTWRSGVSAGQATLPERLLVAAAEIQAFHAGFAVVVHAVRPEMLARKISASCGVSSIRNRPQRE
jgi:hypothetical protein